MPVILHPQKTAGYENALYLRKTGGESGSAVAFAIVGGLSVALIFILSYGNIVAATALLACAAVVLITWYRLDWGFCLFIGLVLSFDQFDIPGFQPLTLKISYFENLKEIPYVPPLDAAVMNPLELQLSLLLFVWLVLICVKKNVHVHPIPLWPALAMLFAGIISSLIFGLRRGGDFLPALWEVRALFYFGILYVFVPQVIQTKEQIRTLVWVCMVAIAFKALQGILRYVQIGFSLEGYPTLTNHEDPVFFTTLIVLLFGLVLFGGDVKQRRALMWILPLLVMGFLVAQRRAAYAAAGASSLTFFVLLSNRERWLLLRSLFPFLILFTIYCTVMWDSDSKWASPVRLVKSGFGNDPATAGERFYSNLYREREKYDLASTVQRYPAWGIGFGNKYDLPVDLVHIPFPLRDYIPHNQILWLLVKLGATGFFLFWLFFDSFLFRGSSVFSRLNDPYLKSVCAVIVIAVINQMVTSYYDLQLTYYRNMVYLGTLTGLLGTLPRIDRAPAMTKETK